MKFSPKALIIALCSLVGVAAVATTAVVLVNNSSKSKSSYTVKFELCTDLETTAVNDREVEPGAFLEEPEVYVTGSNEENWGIEGWYRDKSYEVQWDFDFDIVESDMTLYAKWKINPQCTVNFWTLDSDKAIYTAQIRKGLTTSRCDDKFIGREVLGYYTDKEMTEEYDFSEKVNKNLDLWVKLSDYVYFSPEAIMKMNLCGNQVEVTEYEATRSISLDGSVVTIGGKNGAYFWLKDLDLAMNGTSIIQIKAREVNDNYSGLLTGFIMGSYTLNGEVGTAGDFGEEYTGSMVYGKSQEPDEDGFYTFTYNLSALAPGLAYDKMTGFRFGIVGTDKYSFEIKEIRTMVDEYAVSGEVFLAKDGINFNALHLNTFTLMGGAQTEMIGKELLSFGGPNGAYIYRKELEISLGEEQIVRVKAKGDLKGGALAMFFFGDYTINGKVGSTTDFTGQHRVTFVKESTDANGFTTYVADISSAIQGLKYKTIKGFRLDLYGEGTRTVQLKSVVSEAPNAEEKQIAADFNAKGINFTGKHLNKFLSMGGAEKELFSNGNLKFTGENGAFIYYKNLNNVMGDQQKLRLTAKGDLKNGIVALFLFGDYTENGKTGTTTDYTGKQRVTFTKEGVTADGYTTYVADLTSIASNFKFNTIKGLRLDLYGEGSRSLEIQSLKSFAPSKEEAEANKDFVANGIDFTGVHFNQFTAMGDAEVKLLANEDYRFGGPNGAFVYRKNLKITMGDEQYIEGLGAYLGGDVCSEENYANYLTTTLNYGAAMLSYDLYYVQDKTHDKLAKEYYTNLYYARKYSAEKPFWGFTQAGTDFVDTTVNKDDTRATVNHLYMETNTALAMGARGISYYSLIKVQDLKNNNALINADGTPNRGTEAKYNYYDAAARMNEYITQIDHFLMQATHKGAIVTNENIKGWIQDAAITEYNGTTVTCSNNSSTTGDQGVYNGAMVGCFDYYGDEVYLVTNTSDTNAVEVTLNLGGECGVKLVTMDDPMNPTYSTTDTITRTIPAGESFCICARRH